MTDSQAALLALFSRVAYGDNVALPVVWRPDTGFDNLTANGEFEAVVYTTSNHSQIVIAFRGSGANLGDWAGANRALAGVGTDWDYQFLSALNLTEAVKRAYPGAAILVTGHSLGGSLAQVAAAMFRLDGAAFAPAGAENVVNSDEFGSIGDAWRIKKVDRGTPGADFTNYVVGGSLIGPITGANVGKDVLIAVDVAEAVSLSVAASLAPRGIDILITGYIQGETLHARDRIAEYMVARANGVVADYFNVRVREALVAAQSGDYGISSQTGPAGTSSWFGSDDPNYLFTDNGDNNVQGLAGDDQIFTYAGNDTVDAGSGNDFVSTAQGDDVIDGGLGNDEIFAGSGDDTISVIGNFFTTDIVDGGSGTDTLNIDYTGLNGSGRYEFGPTVLNASASFTSIRDALARTTSFVIVGANGDTRTEASGVEQINLTTGNGQALVIFQNGTTYKATSAVDTFFADWSNATSAITWLNEPTKTQTINGVSLTGMERLLLATGSGNDTISNTLVLTDDEIHTGAGNDTINAGSGSDRVYAGPGDDTISVIGNFFTTDIVDGGSGTDTLNIDYTGLNGSGRYEFGPTVLNASASFTSIRDALARTTSFVIVGANGDTRTEASGVEQINLTTGNGQALVIFQNGTTYKATSAVDTFFADWSNATSAITWLNEPTKTQTINGVSLTGMERLLLATGSGNDTISNTLVLTDDEIHTGAGNDTINAGSGSDLLYGGQGIDLAIYGGIRRSYTLVHTASGYEVKSPLEGTDQLTAVERLAFADTRVALDLDGNAGITAKIIGAVFGKTYLSNKAFVGIGLQLLDDGISYPDLVSLAIGTDLFAQLAGSRSDADFVKLVYRNVVGAAPSRADLDYFVGLLDTDAFTQSSLALLACETDMNRINVDLVGLINTGIEFLPPA